MIKRGQAITLDNNIKYLVLCKVKYQNDNYLYLTSMQEKSTIMICKEDKDRVIVVKDETILNELIPLFDKDIKEIL